MLPFPILLSLRHGKFPPFDALQRWEPWPASITVVLTCGGGGGDVLLLRWRLRSVASRRFLEPNRLIFSDETCPEQFLKPNRFFNPSRVRQVPKQRIVIRWPHGPILTWKVSSRLGQTDTAISLTRLIFQFSFELKSRDSEN
jgi:hypothetical protein